MLSQSLFQDDRGRIWVFTGHGLAYFKDGRFVARRWRAQRRSVFHHGGQGRQSLAFREQGPLALAGWTFGRAIFPGQRWGVTNKLRLIVLETKAECGLHSGPDGGVLYFKDGQVRASYTAANGLGKGHVAGLRLDRDGALWAATQDGGLSRIKDGRIATLTTKNGLPCDTIHWTIEDDDRSFWLYTACGLVRIARTELDAWIADPKRRIETTVWDAADGVRLRSTSPSLLRSSRREVYRRQTVVRDGRRRSSRRSPSSCCQQSPAAGHIEQIIADDKMYWQNLPGDAQFRTCVCRHGFVICRSTTPLSASSRRRRFISSTSWRGRTVTGERWSTIAKCSIRTFAPGPYRFRVIACNNSGVWNEQGDTLEFSVAPAYYQTNWFRALCAQPSFWRCCGRPTRYRVRRLQHDFEMTLEARIGERTRIARDLHDTLLQSFHGLLLRFQTVSSTAAGAPD